MCRSKWLAGLAGVWVRPVDKLVGEAVGMRVDVELADGTTAVGIYYHRLLSQSVGCAHPVTRCCCVLGPTVTLHLRPTSLLAIVPWLTSVWKGMSLCLQEVGFHTAWLSTAPAPLRAGCAERRLCARC